MHFTLSLEISHPLLFVYFAETNCKAAQDPGIGLMRPLALLPSNHRRHKCFWSRHDEQTALEPGPCLFCIIGQAAQVLLDV